MNKYNYHGKNGTRANKRQHEVKNRYNYHRKNGTRAKHQKR